jgi:hypothetical protein
MRLEFAEWYGRRSAFCVCLRHSVCLYRQESSKLSEDREIMRSANRQEFAVADTTGSLTALPWALRAPCGWMPCFFIEGDKVGPVEDLVATGPPAGAVRSISVAAASASGFLWARVVSTSTMKPFRFSALVWVTSRSLALVYSLFWYSRASGSVALEWVGLLRLSPVNSIVGSGPQAYRNRSCPYEQSDCGTPTPRSRSYRC